ncbi:MAG TPA: metallophosphoesterase [Bacillales bacterium]|nr:metallophosphoesterase [Bacillales bacterium]
MVVFIILFVLACFLVLLYMWIEAHQNVVYRHEFRLDGLPDGFNGTRLFFISDVHRRSVSDKLIQQVKDKAELVIIGGDLMERKVPFQRVEKNLERLAEIGPVYFVWGNNDYEDDFRKLDTLLREKGVIVLDNTATRLEAGGDSLVLLGVDDYGLERDRLDLAVKDSPEGYRILVSHNPGIVSEMNRDLEIPFVLSGHTHGGQIRLFGWGPREKGGIKHFPELTLFISNGYGTTTLPLRLGAPAQTHLITLKNK